MTSYDDFSCRVFQSENTDAGIDSDWDFRKCNFETLMNQASFTIRISNWMVDEICNPVVDSAASTISYNNAIISRIISTVSLDLTD